MSNKAIPLNQINAIDIAAFIINFDRSFTQEEEKKLLALKEILKDEFPSFSQDRKFEVKVEQARFIHQEHPPAGIKLQKMKPDGSLAWLFYIIENKIIVACHDYTRWCEIWQKAQNCFNEAFQLIDMKELKIESLVLQYIDKFITDAKDYNTSDVFAQTTPFLSRHIWECKDIWHIHQGWFEAHSETERLLHNLNMRTEEIDKNQIITSITHTINHQFLPSQPACDIIENNRYQIIFEALHDHNKSVIKKLINESQIEAIGLG